MPGANLTQELKPPVNVFSIDAFVFDEVKRPQDARVGKLGFLESDLKLVAKRGQSVAIAQFYGLVLTGTILTKHVFSGLRRPMLTDGDLAADKACLVYTRKPAFDFRWAGSPTDGGIEQIAAPPGAVFAIYTSKNLRHRDAFPEIDGWINYWAWVDEDQGLSEAPIDWVGRYEEKLWTRENNER
jgi:hypothetical protein